MEGLTIAQGKREEYSCITPSAKFFENIYVLGIVSKHLYIISNKLAI